MILESKSVGYGTKSRVLVVTRGRLERTSLVSIDLLGLGAQQRVIWRLVPRTDGWSARASDVLGARKRKNESRLARERALTRDHRGRQSGVPVVHQQCVNETWALTKDDNRGWSVRFDRTRVRANDTRP